LKSAALASGANATCSSASATIVGHPRRNRTRVAKEATREDYVARLGTANASLVWPGDLVLGQGLAAGVRQAIA
jgi:hypothetical protein